MSNVISTLVVKSDLVTVRTRILDVMSAVGNFPTVLLVDIQTLAVRVVCCTLVAGVNGIAANCAKIVKLDDPVQAVLDGVIAAKSDGVLVKLNGAVRIEGLRPVVASMVTEFS